MSHIINFIIFMLSRHERESTRVHYEDSATYRFLNLLSNKLWNRVKSWYTENRWYTKSWWIKVPFSFANDGWKFWSWIMIYSACYEFAFGITRFYELPLRFDWMWDWVGLTWIYALLLMIIVGIYHSILSGSLLRRKYGE